MWRTALALLAWLALNAGAWAQAPSAHTGPYKVYVLGDSIAHGLVLDGFADKLSAQADVELKINFDGARSITTPGNQVKRSALAAVDDDQAFIAKASVIVLVLGMNQTDSPFEANQARLIAKLKGIAPKARYIWVDIGATISNQATAWSERNRIIYANADNLGYQVVSRYRAIFGAQADPLHIEAGRNFADWVTEAGYGGEGNVHGFSTELGQSLITAILDALDPSAACKRVQRMNAYVLGDSIATGLAMDGFAERLKRQLGADVTISADVGRSITQPGFTLKKSALQSLQEDRERIAAAQVIVIILGTNQTEASFAEAQQTLMQQLRSLAPKAQFFWVDIGATIASQAAAWSARNQTIYNNAKPLNYTVVSRYKAIFGQQANPLQIEGGKLFPGEPAEPGFDSLGNVHGKPRELAQALMNTLPQPMSARRRLGCRG
jgi:lysophospholipase L1-like esterase